jgi:hypothetical protein
MKLKEDKIAWVRDYYDAHLLLLQLGIVSSLEEEQARAGGDSTNR